MVIKMKKVIFQIYPHFIKRMQQFYEENEKDSKADVVFVGDSLIEMYDLKTFEVPFKMMNRGIVSDKSMGVLTSLQDRVLTLKPKLVILLIGSNDICDGYSLFQIKTNINDILIEFEKNEITTILLNVLPPCYHKASHVDSIYPDCRDIVRIKELNNLLKDLSLQFKDVTLFDTFSLLADEFQSLAVEDTLDGVHLTSSAYQKITNQLKPLIIQKLSKIEEERK